MPKISKEEAIAMIRVGAVYQHPEFTNAGVRVTGINPATGNVSYEKESGPGLADMHRQMYAPDFASVYILGVDPDPHHDVL